MRSNQLCPFSFVAESGGKSNTAGTIRKRARGRCFQWVPSDAEWDRVVISKQRESEWRSRGDDSPAARDDPTEIVSCLRVVSSCVRRAILAGHGVCGQGGGGGKRGRWEEITRLRRDTTQVATFIRIRSMLRRPRHSGGPAALRRGGRRFVRLREG